MNAIFHYKPSSWAYPIYGNPICIYIYIYVSIYIYICMYTVNINPSNMRVSCKFSCKPIQWQEDPQTHPLVVLCTRSVQKLRTAQVLSPRVWTAVPWQGSLPANLRPKQFNMGWFGCILSNCWGLLLFGGESCTFIVKLTPPLSAGETRKFKSNILPWARVEISGTRPFGSNGLQIILRRLHETHETHACSHSSSAAPPDFADASRKSSAAETNR